MKVNYLNYINNLRGFVIILIVGAHCLSMKLLNWTPTSELREILSLILHSSSAYFVFIAGFLFQFLIQKYTFSSYFKRKFLFVILPYLLMSIPGIIDEIYHPRDIYAVLPIYQQVLIYYLTGIHVVHFWFIPAIILFYLASPIFKKLDQFPHFYWILPALFLMSVFVPRGANPSIDQSLRGFLHFLVFYVLGMWMSHYRTLILQWAKYSFVGIFLFISLLILQWFMIKAFGEDNLLVNFTYVAKYIIACFVLVNLFYQFDKSLGKSLNFLAESSFGIYFVHYYFVILLERILIKLQLVIPANFFTFLLLVLMITACSYFTLMLVKRIFGKNSRMLTGY
jgi:peptidoglycan/LPS O-acetylase OafA/YrhL